MSDPALIANESEIPAQEGVALHQLSAPLALEEQQTAAGTIQTLWCVVCINFLESKPLKCLNTETNKASISIQNPLCF